LVVDPETGLIYNWHRLLHVRGDHYWTGIQDKVLISTGGTYAGEPINSSLLTTDGDIEHVNLYGELSPDGNKIAYTEKFSLFIYDLLTQRSIKITPPNIWVDDFSWSPDSKYISFISPNQVNEVFEGAYKPSDSFKIMRVRVTDGSVFPVTKSLRDEYAWDLQWSGDGAMLSLYYDSNISLFFADGSGYYEIQEFANHCRPLLHFYTWLHKGSKLSMFCENNPTQLWILDTKTGSAKLIKEFTELNLREDIWPSEMAWSPDDTQLASTITRKNAHCTATWEGMPICPEDMYVYNINSDTLQRIAIKSWLYNIQDIEWVNVNSE